MMTLAAAGTEEQLHALGTRALGAMQHSTVEEGEWEVRVEALPGAPMNHQEVAGFKALRRLTPEERQQLIGEGGGLLYPLLLDSLDGEVILESQDASGHLIVARLNVLEAPNVALALPVQQVLAGRQEGKLGAVCGIGVLAISSQERNIQLTITDPAPLLEKIAGLLGLQAFPEPGIAMGVDIVAALRSQA